MRGSSSVAVACLVAVAGSGVAGQEVVTLRNNGPNEKRINVVVLGDGYTSDELARYSTHVDRVVAGFFHEEPFSTYEAYFNVYRIDVVSRESGSDHPSQDIHRDTALDSRYDCHDIPRLICVDRSAVQRFLPWYTDIVVVLVNDSVYGGMGGATITGIPLAVAAMQEEVVELVLHEIGHSFGNLADEYYADEWPCYMSEEPPAVNATLLSPEYDLKWSYWVEPGTPVPSRSTVAGRVGAYKGAMRYPCGLYRPTYNSKMRTLGNSFDSVNMEQLITRIYNYISPIDMVDPDSQVVRSDGCGIVNFVVHVPRASLETTWRLDGQETAIGDSLDVVGCRLREGRYRVEVEVRDDNPAVRRGSDRETRSWDLIVSGPGCSCGG